MHGAARLVVSWILHSIFSYECETGVVGSPKVIVIFSDKFRFCIILMFFRRKYKTVLNDSLMQGMSKNLRYEIVDNSRMRRALFVRRTLEDL